MTVAGKVVAVTGGGSGIGSALCERFARDGAAGVAVIDLHQGKAEAVADRVGGVAHRCDVGDEADLNRVVTAVEAQLGPIDIFCSNAGVLNPDPNPGDPTSASNHVWSRNWAIHVMAHVYAARRLAPEMSARGGGHLVNTISAAGLLTHLGGASYSATKHAAVGFAESLAIAYRHLRVSILCPQVVETPMVADTARSLAEADGVLSPADVADAMIKGMSENRFLILPHPQVHNYMMRKSGDYDRWVGGMSKLARLTAPLL